MIRQSDTTEDELLNRAQVAAMLNIEPHTLACWRSAGRGPACVKYGAGRSAPIRYRRSAVEAWLADPVAAEAAAREPWREARRQAIAAKAITKVSPSTSPTKSTSPRDRRPARARA